MKRLAIATVLALGGGHILGRSKGFYTPGRHQRRKYGRNNHAGGNQDGGVLGRIGVHGVCLGNDHGNRRSIASGG